MVLPAAPTARVAIRVDQFNAEKAELQSKLHTATDAESAAKAGV